MVKLETREKVDAGCKKLISDWVRKQYKGVNDTKLCRFYENIEDSVPNFNIESGVYT